MSFFFDQAEKLNLRQRAISHIQLSLYGDLGTSKPEMLVQQESLHIIYLGTLSYEIITLYSAKARLMIQKKKNFTQLYYQAQIEHNI